DRGVYVGPVRISTPRLHLRGVDRSGVIIDGRHRVGNGITITANGVWVENLTVRNFDRRTRDDASNGNEIWWGGLTGHRTTVRGWWGQYLTAYDTGLLGGYGLYAAHAVDGWFKHVYASGFNDSGLYVGGCRDCRAVVQDALVERNAVGWTSTNAGGHLIVEGSTFRDNGDGIGPDSESVSDLPPPQDGACNSASNRIKLPVFTSAQISRCTIFQHNLIEDNGNLDTPANSDVLEAPWGIGVVLGGAYADLVEDNTIRGNPNFGVLLLERPDPFPPTPRTIYFQVSGNRISNNTLIGNATMPGSADIGLEGGAFGTQSVNNCFAGNTFVTSSPADIEGTWGCQNATTPNGGSDLFSEILKLVAQSGARHSEPQPPPHRQPTMPRPCRGVPRNPLCR
ncbi:MAG: right-handed parallel beta-helix repeat-containing protein, partial [Solirubrobacterales bacterium]|nr:right-handed parallel beta-helix repeat-containing protein [Solirubrobacterales bacterium]